MKTKFGDYVSWCIWRKTHYRKCWNWFPSAGRHRPTRRSVIAIVVANMARGTAAVWMVFLLSYRQHWEACSETQATPQEETSGVCLDTRPAKRNRRLKEMVRTGQAFSTSVYFAEVCAAAKFRLHRQIICVIYNHYLGSSAEWIILYNVYASRQNCIYHVCISCLFLIERFTSKIRAI
jgi:hypothetical protein